MCSVCRAESIVDEDVGIRGELCRKGRIILLFARMEAHVLQQDEFAWPQTLHRIFGPHAECVPRGGNHHLQVMRESLSCGAKSKSINDLSVRTSEV